MKLSEMLNVTSETIRRDLPYWNQKAPQDS
ncbi:DeoR family transcriptional regulator [Salmonella enterica subsp. enterica]|nr:DeoR family transcriptional regulator [Salmonella enterica subsp. enterica]